MQRNQPTRREFLYLSAGGLLAAGLWPGALRAEGEADSKEFHFIAVNDTHYLDKKCDAWMTKMLQQIKGHPEKIDFCLLVGDVTDKGTKEEMAAMRDHLKDAGRTVYVVVGNHDYLTQTDRKAYEEFFPERINYHFEHGGWQFVGLDSSDGVKASGTNVLPHTLKWLDERLPKLDRKKPTVLFTHFPLNAMVKSSPKNAEAVLDRFKEFNLQAVYNGHHHGFTETRVRDVPITTNRCCAFSRGNHDGTKEKGYFLCHAKDGKIERTFVEVKPI